MSRGSLTVKVKPGGVRSYHERNRSAGGIA
jgi:hypothetical protein